ncbi:hypothetical protein BGZ95_010568 [Linnemannia exigua]|uniref:Uncharacterized protein n=1 Tax=Linnemannia exigua TaxID=604196 RepID=A0AAD4DB59_9FUNG|nr:hypothetical protein BGZ95_010568 [Linnemannia exigua]
MGLYVGVVLQVVQTLYAMYSAGLDSYRYASAEHSDIRHLLAILLLAWVMVILRIYFLVYIRQFEDKPVQTSRIYILAMFSFAIFCLILDAGVPAYLEENKKSAFMGLTILLPVVRLGVFGGDPLWGNF